MARKTKEVAEVKASEPEVKAPEVNEEVAEVKKKQSVREIMEMEAAEIIADAEKLIPRLNDLQAFAIKNARPHRHFYKFSNDLQSFVNQFKRMLR